jgi:hypothetical protein
MQLEEAALEALPALTSLIDRACGPLAERIENGRMPAVMRVHPSAFARIREIRAREITDGYPLMFLGMELTSDASLPTDGFAFVD